MRDGTKLHTAVYTPRTCPPVARPSCCSARRTARAPMGPTPTLRSPDRRARSPTNRGSSPTRTSAGAICRKANGKRYGPTSRQARHGLGRVVRRLRHHRLAGQERAVQQRQRRHVGHFVSGLLRARGADRRAPRARRPSSPQAPVTDYYLDDDSYHNGAFLLAHNFSFYVDFPPRGRQPRRPAARHSEFEYGTQDGYRFYLDGGSLIDMSREVRARQEPVLDDEPRAHDLRRLLEGPFDLAAPSRT